MFPGPNREATSPHLRFNGFVKTENFAYPNPGIHMDTAAAISGAAVSPNMGYHSNPATAFLMTVFDVRLGLWLANPRRLDRGWNEAGYPRWRAAEGHA